MMSIAPVVCVPLSHPRADEAARTLGGAIQQGSINDDTSTNSPLLFRLSDPFIHVAWLGDRAITVRMSMPCLVSLRSIGRRRVRA